MQVQAVLTTRNNQNNFTYTLLLVELFLWRRRNSILAAKLFYNAFSLITVF
jgi:hypothetical protein